MSDCCCMPCAGNFRGSIFLDSDAAGQIGLGHDRRTCVLGCLAILGKFSRTHRFAGPARGRLRANDTGGIDLLGNHFFPSSAGGAGNRLDRLAAPAARLRVKSPPPLVWRRFYLSPVWEPSFPPAATCGCFLRCRITMIRVSQNAPSDTGPLTITDPNNRG